MRIVFEPPPAYFVHVPKTGGLTMGSLLETAYTRANYLRMNIRTLAQTAPAQLRHYRCYHSMHQGRAMLELIGRHDLTLFTFVREPIERTVSQILYLQRVVAKHPEAFTPDYLAAVAPIVQTDFSDDLDPQAFAQACDAQIRALGVLEDYTPLFKGSPDADSGRTLVSPYPLPPKMDSGNKDLLLENACSWLGAMAVVGVTEHYAESVQMICDALGLPMPAHLPRHNRNPQRTDPAVHYQRQLPPKVVAQLAELTRHDQELYACAYDHFQQQWANFRAHPRRTYSLAPRLRLAAPKLRQKLAAVKRVIKAEQRALA